MSTTEDQLLSYLSPASLGLKSEKYAAFRPVQLDAIEIAAYGNHRFTGLALPTGSGKSLVAMALARLTGKRTVVLTATKGLQQQYLADHTAHGLRDIRGRGNYYCSTHGDCSLGADMGCQARDQCSYKEAKDLAVQGSMVVTNYSYWLTAMNHGTGLGAVDLLIMDEAHEAMEQVAGFLSCHLYEKELTALRPVGEWLELEEDLAKWKVFVLPVLRDLMQEIRTTEMEVEANSKGNNTLAVKGVEVLKRMRKLQAKFETILGAEDGEWVMERKDGTRVGRVWDLDVVWPAKYAERYLFHGVEKVVLMSATLRPQTMHMLGISSDRMDFKEWARIFPASRGPLYHLPAMKPTATGKAMVRLNYKSSPEDLKLWLERIDEIIEARGDRKGLIHTVSYHRQKYLLEKSRFRDRMMGNTTDPDSENSQEIFERFKKESAPAIMVSPSFSTGWDFAGPLAEYQILAKVPFPPSVSKVIQARKDRDPRYLDYLAMQNLMQAAGRIQRFMEDRGETFIVDGALTYFMNRNKYMAPKWFTDDLRRIARLPMRPEKLK